MNHFKDLWLAVLLIAGASAVLLFSDLDQRNRKQRHNKKSFPSVAIMQITSTTLLDEHIAGVMDRLQSGGYVAPDAANVRIFNAQGDYAMANTIAREIVNGPYELVITSSTLALQIFSKTNVSVQKNHVFGAVTDPYGAGVGISGPEPHQHPSYMTGIGTFQPVQSAFRLAKEMNPLLKRVGVVWNPGEQCSEACMIEAKAICRELGIELVEAVATNTSEVSEAVRSLVSKQVEAIWIGGDTVANASISMIIGIARQAGIPVFTNDHTDAQKGALFGLGANYFTVGQYTANMAVAILEGVSPASFRIENVVPELFRLNQEVLATLNSSWAINDVVQTLLDQDDPSDVSEPITFDFASIAPNNPMPETDVLKMANRFLNLGSYRGAPARVAMVTLVENQTLEEAARGVEEGLQESGLVSGIDYTVRRYSAQGEIGMLPQLFDAVIREKPDLIVTITTPALLAMAAKSTNIPVVFTVASDPEILGIFKNGRPAHICGVHDNPPVDLLVDMAKQYDSNLSAVGIVYDAAQVNSLISVEKLRKAGPEKQVRILEATASTVTDLGMATQSLIQRGARAILISADNLAITGFAVIHRVTSGAGVPVYTTDPGLVELGAAGAIGDSYFDWGKQSGKLAAKVLAGVPVAQLPIEETKVQKRIDPGSSAANLAITTPFKLRIVHYSETEFAERSHEGLVDGLKIAGLEEGRHYQLQTYNAQGDMSTLSSIMSTIKADRVDLLMVISTPALQAALRQAGPDTKIVFTGVGDAVKAGAGKSETDHLPNVTGVTTRSSFSGMARIIKQTLPEARRVGTLFTPAEINSVLYKDWFKEALEEEGLELVAIPVTSSADVSQAAADLCGRNLHVLCQIVDNMTRPGFALIARKAAEKNVPVFVFDSDQMKDGGAICLSREYYDAGVEAAEKAVRVLRGQNPASIPFHNTSSETFMVNMELVKRYGLRLPEDLLEKATLYIP
jgi:ABC-type uncharacterized transport system substrate-binding protein